MNVPDVVKIAIRMKAHMATDGPASHSQVLIPNRTGCWRAAGPSPPPRMRWMMPRGSWNQLGPVMANSPRKALMAPDAENRNSHRTVIATEEVTDGK